MSTTVPVPVAALTALLERFRFDESSEEALQRGVEAVLTDGRWTFEREAVLSRQDRVDFLTSGIGVECKLDGSLSAVTRQLHRYAQSDRVDALVLVTTRARLARVPRLLNRKPVAVVLTLGGLL